MHVSGFHATWRFAQTSFGRIAYIERYRSPRKTNRGNNAAYRSEIDDADNSLREDTNP
jgi:hypothetical protein